MKATGTIVVDVDGNVLGPGDRVEVLDHRDRERWLGEVGEVQTFVSDGRMVMVLVAGWSPYFLPSLLRRLP